MLEITADQRRSLRSRAHGLNPVVSISQNGLTESVLKEIGVSLNSHELIKIRVYIDDRKERDRLLNEICETLGAAPVQHIGKLLIIWRPDAEEKSAPAKSHRPPRRRAEPRKTKRSFQA